MMVEHDIGPAAQVPRGEGRNFSVGGATIAVFRTHAGEIYATQPNCPHRQGPLADGLMGGTVIVCPLHDRAWDLRTGQPMQPDCSLATYPAWLTEKQSIVVAVPG